MFKSIKSAGLVTVFVVTSAFNVFASKAVTSTAADVQSVEVTVYNSNLGLVKEQRKIKVNSGMGELRYADVAEHINPVTVHVKPLSNASDFTILEQNYEYDLISHQKLLDKYIGKKIKIVDWNEFKDRKTIVEAELLSVGQNSGLGVGGGEVYKIDNEIYLGHPGTKVLPSLPDNLISRPTLSWLYRSKTAREYRLEVSYLTHGLNWNADYIFVTSDTKPTADISGWVTINNHSGAAYNNAKLKLIAGNVNRVQPVRARNYAGGEMLMRDAMAAPQAEFAQTDVFEYKMYDLERPTTIKNNQTKQINLMEGRGFTVEKEYITTSTMRNFSRGNRFDGVTKQTVNAFISFKNTKENRLGNPLPAGTVRLYAADAAGRQQFIGEDRIEHTPKDETVRLRVGEVFDIVAERKQLDFSQKTSQMSESEWEIKVRNRKEEDITVGIIESAHGNWEVISSNQKHTKVDANTLRFDVAVPKGKEVVVNYKIRVGI